MSLLGNIFWLIFGGLLMSLSWFVAGLIMCITIIGIPFGLQCFKIARLTLAPFGKDIVYGSGTGNFLMNIIWILLCGWGLALEAIGIGIFFCITIVGIPIGLQSFKFAKLALMPFGSEIR